MIVGALDVAFSIARSSSDRVRSPGSGGGVVIGISQRRKIQLHKSLVPPVDHVVAYLLLELAAKIGRATFPVFIWMSVLSPGIRSQPVTGKWSKTPDHRHDEDSDEEEPDQKRQSEFPIVVELVPSRPHHHEIRRRRDWGQKRAGCGNRCAHQNGPR